MSSIMAIVTWLAQTRLGKWVSLVVGSIGILLAAVLVGWSKRGQKEANKALKGYEKERKKQDAEDYIDYNDDSTSKRLREFSRKS